MDLAQKWSKYCEEQAKQYNSTKAVRQPEDIAGIFAFLTEEAQEQTWIATFDGANKLIDKHLIAIGSYNQAMVPTAVIMKKCVLDTAVAFTFVHNHPSGSLLPSNNDIDAVKKLKRAGEIMDIILLDAIIVSKAGHYSFEQQGTM